MNFKPLVKKIAWFLNASKILNNMPDMLLYTDFDGNILEANYAAKDNFGITENITIDELFDNGLNIIKKSILNKKSILIKTKFQNEYMELTASTIGNNYCICIRDNTKVINDNIEKKGIEKFNNEKNAFLVKLENEIKSPLNSITGFCQGLVDGIGGEITQKQSKYLKIIQSNANDISELAGELLDFSYAESLFYEPNYKSFDIIFEIRNIIKEFEKDHNFENSNLNFEYENFGMRNIYCDYKVISKFVRNILEASSKEGCDRNIQIILSIPDEETSISYALYDGKKYIQIKIKDNNPAISEEELKYICNPYAQIDKGKKQIIKSLRFGTISILAKRADGYFSINSDNGNLYSLIIPVEKEENE